MNFFPLKVPQANTAQASLAQVTSTTPAPTTWATLLDTPPATPTTTVATTLATGRDTGATGRGTGTGSTLAKKVEEANCVIHAVMIL